MISKITSNIKVSVYPEYDFKNSFPSEGRFMFRYNIIIENQSDDVVMLLKRKWSIFDTGFGITEVEGDGVIGLTPVLQPGEVFKYFSNVVLRSGVGNMSGNYLFIGKLNGLYLNVEIPKFSLIAEVLSN
ncbi:Co2+/Mg2+ efflux protein ApaG [Chryseobacterium sp. T1]